MHCPVVTSVSQATRDLGSTLRIASRIASEIWSATLSGWPMETDSLVNRCVLRRNWEDTGSTPRKKGKRRSPRPIRRGNGRGKECSERPGGRQEEGFSHRWG